MTIPARVYGGSQYRTLSGTGTTTVLLNGSPVVQTFNVTGTGNIVRLPTNTGAPLGGPIFRILNVGTQSLTIKNSASTTVANVAAGKQLICLRFNETVSGWAFILRTIGTARAFAVTSRTIVHNNPAICLGGKYMLVQCDDPTSVFYSNSNILATALGLVVRFGTFCYRVYSIRRSHEDAVPVPEPLNVYEDCAGCYADGGTGGSEVGEGDDSNVDPVDREKLVKYILPTGLDAWQQYYTNPFPP